MPSLPEVKEIHDELLILLKRFDSFCTAHGVCYSLHGGTLLGAIREHGFIPWDDDADLTLTRAEYEKLCRAIHEHPLESDLTFREFASQHPRIWMRREGHPGVWLDLFIYDPISERRLAQKIKLLGCAFFLAFTKTKKSMVISEKVGGHRGLKQRLLKLGYYMGKPFTARFKARMQIFFCKHAFCGKRRLIHRANDQYSAIRLILPAHVMTQYIRVPFESIELMVTANHHEVLTSSYGPDYMTPKRVASHDSIMSDR